MTICLAQLFTRFRGGVRGGNFGIPYDAMTFTYPGAMSMGWIDIYNQKAGIGYYYANQDSETRLMLLDMELRPFGKARIRRMTGLHLPNSPQDNPSA